MMRAPTHGEGRGLQEVRDVDPPLVKESWQQDAYSFTEAIGELGYALNLKANAVAECRLRPEVRIAGTDEWEETDDPRVLRVLGAFKPPQGEQGELLRQAALQYEIAGETYLFGQPARDEHNRPLGLLWEFLSTLECRIDGKGKVVRNAWGGSRGRTAVEVDAYLARLHHRDPRYSERSDCPVRRILPICRELVLLTQVIDAIAKTRLSAGLLYMPWELSPIGGPMDEWENAGNPDTGGDEFEEELAYHLNSPIEDRTAAASLNPLLVRGPALIKDKPAKELIGLIDLGRPLDGLYRELRQEALSRLAGGLDIPPEIITGKSVLSGLGGGNVALSIDADFIAKHIVPLGRVLTSFITAAYLRPMLVTFEEMEPNEADWFRISLDTTPITTESDLSGNATTGVQLEILSDEAWARHNGMEEADIADPDQRMIRTMLRLLYAQPTLGPVIIPALIESGYLGPVDIDFEKWNVGASQPGGAQGGGVPPNQQPQLPPVGAATDREIRLTDLPDTILATILAASDRELDRALERGANRLLSRLNGVDRPQADRLRNEKKVEVLSVAGWETARRAGLDANALFDGCWDELSVRVVGWLRTGLVAAGAEPYKAGAMAAIAAGELAQQLNLHAASALQRPLQVGANGFKLSNDLVLTALAAGDLASKD